MNKKGKKILRNKMIVGVLLLALMIAAWVPAGTVKAEATNVSFDLASELPLNTPVGHEVSTTPRYYKFHIDAASEFRIQGVGNNGFAVDFQIYDAFRTSVYTGYLRSNSNLSVYLTGGDYYLGFAPNSSMIVTFHVQIDDMAESFVETQDSNNNRMDSASEISLKQTYKGVLAQNDDTDYYKFTVPETGRLNFNFTNATNSTVRCTIYDSPINAVYSQDVASYNKEVADIIVTEGEYYLGITQRYAGGGVGSYNFSTDFVAGIPKEPVETAPPVIDFNNTPPTSAPTATPSTDNSNGTGENTPALAKPTIKSVKNSAKNKMIVKWNKVAGVSGYVLQYSTSKKFTKSTVEMIRASKSSATCSELKKGKTYYVRIMAYVNAKGVKQYSKWSAKKTVKMKK